MKRKFVTNLALLLLLNLLVKPFWIGIDIVVQNRVGPEQYGNYFALLQFTFLFNILLDLGITNYNNRNIAQNQQLLSKHFSNLIVIRMMLGMLYLFISVVVGIFFKWELQEMKMLLLLLFNQFLLSFVLYMRSNLSGLHLFRTDSLVSVLDRFLMIVICSALLWGKITETDFKIEWFIYTQTAAYLLTALIVFLLVFSKLDFLRPKFDFSFFRVILKQSYPFAMLILLMTFYTRINPLMLKLLLPDGNFQAGIYAQSFRLLDAASMFAFLFASLLLPIFSRMIKQKEPVGQMVKLSFSLIIVPVIILSAISYFFSTEIIELFYAKTTDLSITTFTILMPGLIFISTSYIFGTLLTANGSLRVLNIMAAIGFVLNIVLNLILIPRLYSVGSATAAIITQAFTAISQIIISLYIFRFKLSFKKLFPFVSFTIILVVYGIFSSHLTDNWIINMLLYAVFGAITAFIFRIFSIKDFYRILKYDDAEA